MDYKNISFSVSQVDRIGYPPSPFNPNYNHPELAHIPYHINSSNHCFKGVYESVRETFEMMGLDKENIHTKNWNPFVSLVKPGQNVVLKPNLVFDQHPLGIEGTLCTITHASVLRPLIDYVLLATQGDVHITICDVPLQSARWDILIKRGEYDKLVEFYFSKGIHIDLLDLRKEISIFDPLNIIIKRDIKERDPLGYSAVDLKEKSALYPVIRYYKNFRITDYGRRIVSEHHNFYKNEYLIPKTILNADLFINVPKMKTHRKAGITCAMKNLIGINGDKSWIAHHRAGSEASGGDEYEVFDLKNYVIWHFWNFLKINQFTIWIARLLKYLYYKFITKGRTIEELKMKSQFSDQMEGSWYGNDTVWRCIADLNYIIFFADINGIFCENPVRKYICVVDGIISGEKEGPMQNSPKKTGIIVSGFNPLSIDSAVAKIMGFNPDKIPSIAKTKDIVHLRYPEPFKNNPDPNLSYPVFDFEPCHSWKSIVK